MFIIDEAALTNVMRYALSGYNGFACILDSENNPITFTNNDGKITDSCYILDAINSTQLNEGINNIKVNNIKYTLTKVVSEYNNWTYIMAKESDQFMEKVNASRAIFSYVIIILLIVGVAIAFLFSNNNYKPLKRLIEAISKQNNPDNILIYNDEFDYLSHSIENISKENEKLISQLYGKAGVMKNQIILKLLKGMMHDLSELENLGTICGLELHGANYAVLVFLFDNINENSLETEKSDYSLLMPNAISIVEELAQQIGRGYGVELIEDKGIALLLSIKDKYMGENYLNELALKVKDIFKRRFNFTLTVGIGNIYEDIEMIHESFLEASRAACFRISKGYDSVIFYTEIEKSEKRKYKYPTNIEDSILMMIRQVRKDNIDETVNELKVYIKNNIMSPEAVQCVFLGIINAIKKCLNELGIEIDEYFADEEDILFMQPYKTVDELGSWMSDFLKRICNSIEQRKESKNQELLDKILDFVDKRYKDNDLSVDIIAREFGVSSSYLCRYFKNQTGYPLMQYIDMLRMNEVKRLLRETDNTLKDILLQTGYIDQSNFIRKFKKKEGVTPIQYRDIAQG